MNSLKVFILSTIARHGIQSDMSLWNHCRLQTLTAVVIATTELERDGYLEDAFAHAIGRKPLGPIKYYDLTVKGRLFIAGSKKEKQEVCLGS